VILAQLSIVWLAEFLPGQDLPQHLAYARIIKDYYRADLPFKDFYILASHFQGYFTAHYAMAYGARLVGLEASFRLIFSFYILGLFLSFHLLARTYQRVARRVEPTTPPWPVLGATMLVWSPVTCMGFVEFMLAVPAFLLGVAFLAECEQDRTIGRGRIGLACCVSAATFLHFVAGGCLTAVIWLNAILTPSRRRFSTAGLAAMTAAFMILALRGVADTGLGRFPPVDWAEAMRRSHGLELIDDVFDIRWSGFFTKLNYVLWTVAGPFRAGGLIMTAGLGVITIAVTLWHRREIGELSSDARGPNAIGRAMAGFAVLSFCAPWGFFVPTEISFVNFRMLTLAFGLFVATIDARWFSWERSYFCVAGFALAITAHAAYRISGFSREAAPVVALMARAQPRGLMLSLVFHNKSQHFAKGFGVTHFLPMYYTVLLGGRNTQFWARYTDHLPVDHRPRQRPVGTEDWSPWDFKTSDLADSDYVLLQAATDEDPFRDRIASKRIRNALDRLTDLVSCSEMWCLFRVRRGAVPGGGANGKL
jgi:hypothetical protein